MRIAFGDFSGWDIHAQSVENVPLGGSQSAACYLAQALARQGHEVFFLTNTSAPGIYAGVTCLSWSQTPPAVLRSLRLDFFVSLLGAGRGPQMRQLLGPEPRSVFWTQHRIDQASVQVLGEVEERESYDGFAFVSEWQRAEFLRAFDLPPGRTQVLRNAAAPPFLEAFGDGQAILPQKAMPPVLAYTSTPYRGLDLLVDALPAICEQVPEIRLRVFSSMQVYQAPVEVDQKQFGGLYERCRQTPGIEYIGSIPQPALARELREASVFAYPNTYPETSCIAVLEAMASGCRIVTSALGALPETTAGFAQLIPVERSREDYLPEFIERTVGGLREVLRGDAGTEEALRSQVRYIRENATWDLRAAEWSEWLQSIGAPKAGG